MTVNEGWYCTSIYCMAVYSGWALWISKEQCLYWEAVVSLVCDSFINRDYKHRTYGYMVFLLGTFWITPFKQEAHEMLLWIKDVRNTNFSASAVVLLKDVPPIGLIKREKDVFFFQFTLTVIYFYSFIVVGKKRQDLSCIKHHCTMQGNKLFEHSDYKNMSTTSTIVWFLKACWKTKHPTLMNAHIDLPIRCIFTIISWGYQWWWSWFFVLSICKLPYDAKCFILMFY